MIKRPKEWKVCLYVAKGAKPIVGYIRAYTRNEAKQRSLIGWGLENIREEYIHVTASPVRQERNNNHAHKRETGLSV